MGYIGERLKEERTAMGEGQVDFSERINKSQPQYHRMENGKRPISADELYVLAEQLELPIQEMFPPQQRDRLLQDETELIEAWRHRDLKELLRLIAERFGG